MSKKGCNFATAFEKRLTTNLIVNRQIVNRKS